MHQGAVAQDLAVMADQAKGYTAGVIQGNAEQAEARSAQAGRLQEEAAQAAAARAREAELDRMQTQEAQMRLAQDSQEASLRLQAAREARELDRRALELEEKGDPKEREAEEIDEKQRQIEFAAASRQKPEFGTVFAELTGQATSRKDIMSLFDNLKAQSGDPLYASVSRSAIDRYARVWEAAAGNRSISLKSLDRPTAARAAAGGTSQQALERLAWQAMQSRARPSAGSASQQNLAPRLGPNFRSYSETGV